MKYFRRITLIAIAMVASLFLAGAQPAKAADNCNYYTLCGQIYVYPYSDTYIKIGNGFTSMNLPQGRWSWEYEAWQDVDSFYIGPGCYVHDPVTGYNYYVPAEGGWIAIGDTFVGHFESRC